MNYILNEKRTVPVMNDFDINHAAYLHDAEIDSISLSFDSSGQRNLTVFLHCHPDCGFEPWNDQYLRLVFVDVLVTKAELLGHTANAETLDSLNEQPSTNLTRIVKRLVTFGVYQPRRLFAIVFHSGSVLEIACQEVSVVVVD